MRCLDARLEIVGHTDSQGDPDENLDLSKRRAEAVAESLTEAGLARDRLSTAGFGDTKPIDNNDTAEGRANNRRIEFKLQ